MIDKITRSFINDFLKNQESEATNDSKDFEDFVNFSIVSKEFKSNFSVENISTGNSAIGIDGTAIIVNGKLVTSTQEIEDLVLGFR